VGEGDDEGERVGSGLFEALPLPEEHTVELKLPDGLGEEAGDLEVVREMVGEADTL
jgi:hypothetical protein